MRRRFRARRTWRFWVGWFALLAIGIRIAYLTQVDDRPRELAEGTYRVSFVIDGDTLVLDDGKKIRLIGVDTPETDTRKRPAEPWGFEATKFARDFLERSDGQLRLQFDHERLDFYNRYLAYVFVGDKMLNEELIRAGLGQFTPGFRYSETMKRRFRLAEREAKTKRLGIWSQAPPSVPSN